MCWSSDEFVKADFGDARLNKRLIKLANTLSSKPTESIPTACGSWHETKSAYRFFSNENVTEEKVLSPHQEATINRMKEYSTILLLQDTTTLNFTGQNAREDLGPLGSDNQRGILLHPTIAVTSDRVCLGVVDVHHWVRKQLRHKTKKVKNREGHKIPLENKESYRWLMGYRKANEIAKKLPGKMIVSIADREGDIYDLYHEAQENFEEGSAYWLIRATTDRRLMGKQGHKIKTKMRSMIEKKGPLCYIEFDLPSREGLPAKKVKQAVYAGKVTLCPPTRKKYKLDFKPVTVNVVIAKEIQPPKGRKPIEWVILTNIEVNSSVRAKEILEWYLCRWQIEIYFRILKSGCKIEKLQLSNAKRFNPCLMLYMIVAWRILYLTMLARRKQSMSCEPYFDKSEWHAIHIILKRQKPPHKPPDLNSMIKMVAQLGGYLNRTHDKEPGPTSIWIGLQRLKDIVLAYDIFSNVGNKIYG